MQPKYIDEDIAAYEAMIFQSAMLCLGAILGGIALIDNGWILFGWLLGGGGLAFGLCGFDGLKKWMNERALVAAYKMQTRSLFVFSNGVSEHEEDDETIIERKDFALEMLARVKNPHEVTVWVLIFRDACCMGYKTGKNGEFVRVVREFREGLTVRETREEYNLFCEKFQAEMEQQELNAKRENANADEWVSAHWFGQNVK
jgi:hypothetical protein